MIGSHVRAFRCRACGYCCYRNKVWDSYLAVDEVTLEKIANEGIDDIERNITISQNHVRQLKCTGNQCSFLNKSNLCDINFKYGYEYLPDACKTYPRIIGLSTRGIEISLIFVCREAIKTIISQNRISFSEEEISGLIRPNIYHYELSSTDEYDMQRIKKYFEFLPNAINGLQNRCLPLKKRLLILGEESLRMSEYAESVNFSEPSIRDSLGSFHEIILSRTYEADNDYTGQYIDNLRKIRSIIDDKTFSLSEYQNIKETFIDREYDKYEYILENYLVNFMTTNIYFFNGSAFGYTMMMILLSSIQLFMAGLAAFYRRSLDEEIIILAIQTVDTAFFGHINWFSNKITDIIKQHGMYDSTKMAVVLGQVL
ncbi:flagellin lysine-N-methylase [Sporomusa malonica]|uniref:Putative zinc-or iron-chelating domain-containing protein n=1 Tax=Sporomusa malonica TaxID=112901 RepID=A0A1W2BA78_9FIRM|nr:flagellin lysine-N-methylase [Sporomusa malonica]SMC69887.1 Putative zinc-or iron-chelating domain-containing protein [Sporomusa malonica]